MATALSTSLRRVLVGLSVLVLATAGLVTASVVSPDPADAAKATGGSGRFVDSIEWFTWGSNRQGLPRAGLTKTQTFTAAGQTVAVTCRIGAVTGGGSSSTPLEAYRPGNWQGDALDELYNIGGPNGANQLVNGLSNTATGTTPTFDFSCSATLNGAALPLAGLVMADAEQSGGGEYVEATIPSGATWRIIDRYRSPGCTQQSDAVRTGQTLRLRNPASSTCPSGPAAVAFMDGASSASNVQVAGGGKSAIALGVAIDFDFGDAPASYGVAGHGLQRSYSGGEVPQGTTNVSSDAFALASPDLPALRLGALVDAEGAQLSSANALGDDTDGTAAFGGPDDEDATTFPTRVAVTPGAPYTQQVACTGTLAVAGWIDFDRNGAFGATERSATATCSAGSADLTWDVPASLAAGDVSTFARIRASALAADVANPVGVAPNGEVEDHALTLRRPSIEITKTATLAPGADGRADAGDAVAYGFEVTNTGLDELTDVQVSDPRVGGAVACGSGPLAVGASRTCTGATYTLTQDDIDTGSVTNTATVTAQPPAGDRVGDTDTAVTRTPAAPGLTLDKTAGEIEDLDGNGPDAGDTITYRFALSNTGNQPLGTVSVSDPRVDPVTCTPATLQPGQAATCSPRTYTLTQADVQAGGVDNTARASGTTAAGRTVTTSDSTSTALARDPSLLLDKQAGTPVDVDGDQLVGPGDTIAYTFEVTNSGNTTVSALTVADPKVGAVDCPVTTLDPDQSTTCTATYTITQDDADTGSVDNRATANASSPGSAGVVSNVDSTATATQAAPGLRVQKTAGTPTDVDADGRVDAGDTITYRFEVTNTGTVTVGRLTISDARTNGANCPVTRLAPQASTTCTKTYAISQADVDAGRVDNSATAAAVAPDGTAVVSAPDTTSTPTSTDATLTVDKAVGSVTDVDRNGTVDAGDAVVYLFTVTNTGAVTLDGVGVVDPLLASVDCQATVLAPGARTTCTGSHTITQAEVNAGAVDNSATATADTPGNTRVTSAPDTTSTPTDTTAALSLVKRAGTPVDVDGDGLIAAGDTIGYTFQVTNTGAPTVSGLRVVDPLLGTVSCPRTTLDADESTTCTGTYTLTQADADAGEVDNAAVVTGDDPAGDPVSSNTSSTRTPTDTAAALTLDKSVASTRDVDADDRLDAGDTIAYEFRVTNTGVVTTTFVGIDDPLTGGANCARTTLAPGQSVTCEQTYTITQAQVDAGVVENTATAQAQDPDGQDVESPSDSTRTTTEQVAGLTIDKAVAGLDDADADGELGVGDSIAYSFAVRNTGTLTTTSLDVVDPRVASVDCPVTSLAPGAGTTCTASHQVTQDDVDAGSVDNTARAEGETPGGDAVVSPADTVSTSIAAASGLTLDKQAGPVVDANGSGRTDAGDTIAYEFVVQNAGAVTLRQLAIDDPKVGTVGCPSTVLARGTGTTCTATYTLTQADLDAGTVSNTAQATTTTTRGAVVRSPQDTADTDLVVSATLVLDKQASAPADTDRDRAISAGDTIAYRFVVTNTGTQTVDEIAVQDARVTVVDCPVTVLAPGASTTCTATYEVTRADIRAGTADNTATVTGDSPGGTTTTSSPDSTSTALPTRPSLSLDKQASLDDADGRPDAGETITYRFVVTNSGGVDVDDLEVDDPMLERSGDAITCPTTTLAPGETTTCTARYTVTEATEGRLVRNVATVNASGPSGDAVLSPSSTAVVPAQDGSAGGGGDGGDDAADGDDTAGDADQADDASADLPDTGGPAALWVVLGLGAVAAGGATVGVDRLRRRRARA
ncbi:CshA/CshB family fibrillar adhesin-related protein [Solicola sp. PLA-1-18]|uniref:CshA/CshB family fibrillar adhesin-related protein n=1 Tax=Solicola sp. PLA-1-18 TaxID=3380532 RepID=UPI003B820FFC